MVTLNKINALPFSLELQNYIITATDSVIIMCPQ